MLKYKLNEFKELKEGVNQSSEREYILNDLIDNVSTIETEEFAIGIVENKQRTSSVNGILKSEAVLLCTVKLEEAGIQTINDFNRVMNDPKSSRRIEKNFKHVKGKGWAFFFIFEDALWG